GLPFRRYTMKALGLRIVFCGLGLLGVLAVPACGSSHDRGEQAASVGTVSLSLTGVGNSGTQYRLTGATFVVSGPKAVTLSSDTDLSGASIKSELPAGNYLIKLNKGWLLQQDNMGVLAPVNAVLTSANPAGFTITDQGVTTVPFLFKAGPDVVQLGDGTLNVV